MFEAFVKAVEDTFEIVAESRAHPIDVAGEPPLDRPRPKDISAVIGFTGSYQGMVILSFPSNVASQIVERSTGELPLTNEETADTVSEFLNMIAGSAKRSLTSTGQSVEMSLPTVVIGRNHEVFHGSEKPCMRIDFESELGAFYIQMSLERVVRPTRVIITDDSRLSRRIMKNALNTLADNVEIIECSDGAGARRSLHELNYEAELLVLDFKMPDMSGLELVRTLRFRRDTGNVPILVVTSDQTAQRQLDELEQELGRELELYRVLLKPFNADVARSLARELIDLSKASQAAMR